MKILVSGASGNVGRHVVEALLKKGEQVRAAGTSLDKLNKLFSDDVETVILDFTDAGTFDKALNDVDRVFLMRPPHLGNAKDLYPFIDRMIVKGIKCVTFLSLMGAAKNPFPPHHKIEKYILKQGLPYVFIRPGFFMQNLIGVHLHEIRHDGDLFIPAGHSKTSFVDAKDVGIASATVLKQWKTYQNTSHTITGRESLTYTQVAGVLSKVLKRPITYQNPGFIEYRHHLVHNRGLDKGYVRVTMMLYLMTRLGTAKKVTNDFTELTDKRPTSFEAFVRRHRETFDL